MSTDRYPYVMAEDLIQLTLGAYTIRIDKSKFDIKQKDNFIAVTAKDNPDLKATISIEKVPRGLDRDGMWRDTFSRDPLGVLHKMRNLEALITGFNSSLVISGHPGFDVISSTSKMAAYRISYWLEGEDAINIFAAFPSESGFKDQIVALATSLHVGKS
jgi:hypothetical protein